MSLSSLAFRLASPARKGPKAIGKKNQVVAFATNAIVLQGHPTPFIPQQTKRAPWRQIQIRISNFR
jgi:hypothetical protein